jgi:hypothetical protein
MDERGRASASRRSSFLGAVVAGRVDQASEFGVLDAKMRSRAVVLPPPVRKPRTTAKIAAFRRAFTMAIKSVNGGPSCNQMEDANSKWSTKSSVVSPHDVQPDRGRVTSSRSFLRPVSNPIPAFSFASGRALRVRQTDRSAGAAEQWRRASKPSFPCPAGSRRPAFADVR